MSEFIYFDQDVVKQISDEELAGFDKNVLKVHEKFIILPYRVGGACLKFCGMLTSAMFTYAAVAEASPRYAAAAVGSLVFQ